MNMEKKERYIELLERFTGDFLDGGRAGVVEWIA